MSAPAISLLARQLASNWEAGGQEELEVQEEQEEELTCLSWLHTVSMPTVQGGQALQGRTQTVSQVHTFLLL